MANTGKSKDFQSVQIGQWKGVMYANSIAFDHGDFVYEITLDTNEGNTKVGESKLFQHALSTFKFTGLLFNQ
jgi:hypothetical protein